MASDGSMRCRIALLREENRVGAELRRDARWR
jgi:hypothetical protein